MMLSEMTKGRLLGAIEQYKTTVANPNVIGMGISAKGNQPAILVCLEKEDLTIPAKIGDFPVVKRVFSKEVDTLDKSEKLMNLAEAVSIASGVLEGKEFPAVKAMSAGIMLALKSLLDKSYLTKEQLEAILSVLKPPETPSVASSP